MNYSKLQIGCLLILLYVASVYLRERNAYKIRQKWRWFDRLLAVGIISVAFDGITAYTVNCIEKVPAVVNAILHMCFLCSLDGVVFGMFWYILGITRGISENRRKRLFLELPVLLSIVIVILFIPELTYCQGEITNYSMGVSVYACYITVAFYMLAAVVVLLMGWRHMGRHKLVTVSTCIAASITVTVYQMLHPQALLTCLVPTLVILGTYLNMENPLFMKLKAHNQEMVMGFATLVENRDGSTGGHIRRTTIYVQMLAEELKRRGFYKEQLTKDFVKKLIMAAPMHDVGKIAIPDAILQKPGKLTDEEYEIMKSHADKGGQIVKETFGKTGDEEYEKMAYEVARYHHEKWNGKGYPDGLKQGEIPLSARIMSVADVFDAVSAKRCYRDAMPLGRCFQIIKEGSGQDFDPVIADIFLEMKDRIVAICEAGDGLKL